MFHVSPDGSLAPVVVDSPGKLDDDYIARFLGQLNLVEESRLIQLLQWLSCTHKEKVSVVGDALPLPNSCFYTFSQFVFSFSGTNHTSGVLDPALL